MNGLDVVVIIGASILVGVALAPRLRLALPVVLLLVGIVAGFVPDLRDIHLPSEAVLVLFLPALLFWESLTTSLRRIRADLRGIILTSTVLVGFTAISVAGLATALGMSWAAALILGAAIAPTDATAVGALARSLPPRPLTLLRAESLINDGTALVIYALAVETAVDGRSFTPIEVTGRLALSYAGGVLAGCVIAWMTLQVRRRLDDPVQANVAILLTPFAAFLVAETVHASGVVAAVVCGLIMSQAGPRVGHAAIRRQTEAFWSLGTYVLNGALFVLVGFEVQSAV